jgi:hypothetical protein
LTYNKKEWTTIREIREIGIRYRTAHLSQRLMSDLNQEANNPSGNDVRHDHTSNNIVKEPPEAIDVIYADITGRIDRFLSDRNPNEVRIGTQLKVRESLQVIQKALQDYGYSFLKHTTKLTEGLIHWHYHSMEGRTV